MTRVCCDNTSEFKVVYDGGVMENDVILICNYHISKHPFDKKIISKEVIVN